MSELNIYSFLSLIGFIIGAGIAPAVYMERLLIPAKNSRVTQWMRFLIWIVDAVLVSSSKIICSLSLDNVWFPIAIGMAGLISQFLIALFFYGGKFFYRAIMFVIYALTSFISDFIFSLLYFKVAGHYYINLYGTLDTAVICILVNLFILLNCALLALLLGHKIMKPDPSVALVFMPVCLIICLFLIGLPENLSGRNVVGSDVYFVSIGITFVVYSIFGLLIEHAQKKSADRELADLQCEIEKQRMHYESMESHRDEMAKLRHDYRNVLNAAMYLIENGEADDACRMLEEMARRIKLAKEK